MSTFTPAHVNPRSEDYFPPNGVDEHGIEYTSVPQWMLSNTAVRHADLIIFSTLTSRANPQWFVEGLTRQDIADLQNRSRDAIDAALKSLAAIRALVVIPRGSSLPNDYQLSSYRPFTENEAAEILAAHPIQQNRATNRARRNRRSISYDVRRRVYERDAYRCVVCGGYEHLTIDHIAPWSKGGAHSIENFQTMCRSCNSRKGAR